MKKLFPVMVLLVIFLSSCATTDNFNIVINKPPLSQSEEERWRLLVGKWYGNTLSESGVRREIITVRLDDGTYKIRFRISDQMQVVEERTEVGRWGISGPIYFTIYFGWIEGDEFYPSDSLAPYNQDAYRIIMLNDEIFEYEHVVVQAKFVAKKVPMDFEFPKEHTRIKSE